MAGGNDEDNTQEPFSAAMMMMQGQDDSLCIIMDKMRAVGLCFACLMLLVSVLAGQQ